MQCTLRKLSQQFLCEFPINEIIISVAELDLNLETQERLLKATVDSDLVKKYPLKITYQKAFIKYLLGTLEKQNLEIHEDLYSSYGRLVAISDGKPEYYKHYRIGDSETFLSLKENVHLISEGTTGLRTWQASLVLAEWCLANKNKFLNKNILELGSGIGLTGLAVCLECAPKSFSFSDCHRLVLQTLCENIRLNCKSNDYCDAKLDNRLLLNERMQNGTSISVLNLPWEDINSTIAKELGKIDIILAADVVFDSDLFGPLIEALRNVSLASKEVEDIVFACSERNSKTLEQFLQEIGKCFSVIEEDCPDQAKFVWPKSSPVRVFRFQLN